MKQNSKAAAIIREGRTFLGIELGSTRIKAVLIGPDHKILAAANHDWENRYEDGYWTYRLVDAWTGIQDSYAKLFAQVRAQYGVALERLGGMGVSAMMHGYLPFDKAGNLLSPFRTWRNTTTEKASAELTELFRFNIPQRWSIAHLYQAILNNEPHVDKIGSLTTLAGYIHYCLTGNKALGVGEASGMFPVDSVTGTYNARMLGQFDKLIEARNRTWKLKDILPEILRAGQEAGRLTEEGAKLIDPTGTLTAGVPLCPPEGDAGTGMVATNSVSERTGNVSAGTSVFAMVVLEKELSAVYPEIDMVTTPSGRPVAMVHCNNCTSDLDAWVKLFAEVVALMGLEPEKAALYDALYGKALDGEPDGGGLISYNYYSGEPITRIDEGRPVFIRTPNSRLNLQNFMRTLLYASMATLKLGMDILTGSENVQVKTLLGHGGLFKTTGVAQRLMASALNIPIAVMESAAEGGAWGIALLAGYMVQKSPEQTLEQYLQDKVFSSLESSLEMPNEKDASGFSAFMRLYKEGLEVERAAVRHLN